MPMIHKSNITKKFEMLPKIFLLFNMEFLYSGKNLRFICFSFDSSYICRYDENDKKFKQSSYVFYIFRRPLGKNLADQRFLCQTSSIDLLISHGFDFNKLFKEGGYCVQAFWIK